jgi:hypothetical protein
MILINKVFFLLKNHSKALMLNIKTPALILELIKALINKKFYQAQLIQACSRKNNLTKINSIL